MTTTGSMIVDLQRVLRQMTDLQVLVDEQAEDDGLWFRAQTASEAYLQQALRRLHTAIEAGLGEPRPHGWQPPDISGALLAGAKLYFTQTGTSKPQNIYQDFARVILHANPVVADANGIFPAIYLDLVLPNYRVRLTTAADVQLWQQDDVPSSGCGVRRNSTADTDLR